MKVSFQVEGGVSASEERTAILSTPTAFAVSESLQRLHQLEQRGLHLLSLCELHSKLVFFCFFFGRASEQHSLLLASELDVML